MFDNPPYICLYISLRCFLKSFACHVCRHTDCWSMKKLHFVSSALLRHSTIVQFTTLNRHLALLQCSRVWGTVLHRHEHCASDCYRRLQNGHAFGSCEITKIMASKLVTCNTFQRNRVVPGWAPSPPHPLAGNYSLYI